MFHGRYKFWLPRPTWQVFAPGAWLGEPDFIIPNLITDAGEEDFLQAIFQNVFPIAGGSDFYVGLADQTPAETDALTDISTEPTSAGGYARQAVPRNGTGWPTITTINGHKAIQSQTLSFTASGADFSRNITRAFLCDVSSGTSGVLFSYSGALTAGVLVTDGQTFQMQYEILLD